MNMKHLYIILLVFPLIGFGQGWEQTFGGTGNDYGRSVQQTVDGGYIITGSITSESDFDLYLIKTDENGDEEWSQIYGGVSYQNGYCVQQTIDGGYIITGRTFVTPSYQVYLIKTNEEGEEEWSQTYGGDLSGFERGWSVQQTPDGGYVVLGTNNTSSMYLIKTSELGEEEWSQTFEETGYGKCVDQTNDGGYIITGNPRIYSDNTVTHLIKTSELGEEEWSQTFENFLSNSLQQTPDEGYILCGDKVNNEIQNGWCIKTDQNGNEEWSKEYGGEENDHVSSLDQTNDGGYIITGFFSDTTSLLLIKTDLYGNEEWSKEYGDIGKEVGLSVEQTLDGGYIISGIIKSVEDEDWDVYLIKTDSEGNVETTSTIELPTPTRKRELLKTTNILGQENTTIKNQPLIELYDDGSTEKKIVLE